MFWLFMEPNAAIPTHPHPFSEVTVLESGTVMFLSAEGLTAQAVRGGAEGASAPAQIGEPGVELTAGVSCSRGADS